MFRKTALYGYYPPSLALDRTGRQRMLAIALFCLVAVTAIALAGVVAGTDVDTGIDNCIAGKKPAHIIDVLVDQSDAFSPAQLQFVRSYIQEIVGTMSVGDKLRLYSLGSEGHPLKRHFSRCRVPRGDEVDMLTGNPRLAEKSYREGFGDPLQAATEALLSPRESAVSPLIEALYRLAHNPDGDGQATMLVLFSDGLQNSRVLSLFDSGNSDTRFWQSGSAFVLKGDFARTCVRQFVVQNKYAQETRKPEYKAFWEAYWRQAGVSCLSMERL